jgi:large subunit ribosomal protein L9
MNVILLERVRNLGELGEEVTVRPGYGRNFLIPQGKAVPANDANRARFEGQRAELEKVAQERLASAKERATQLEGVAVTISARASDEGRLYGSIGTREIADAIIEKGIDINKADVRLPEGAIRHIGEYDVELGLHSDVVAVVKLTVIAD